MISNGKFYESQFEEATIELLREAHWQYAFGDDIHRKYTDPRGLKEFSRRSIQRQEFDHLRDGQHCRQSA